MHRFIFSMVPVKCPDSQYNFNTTYKRRYVLFFLRYFLNSIMFPQHKITPKYCIQWRFHPSSNFSDLSTTNLSYIFRRILQNRVPRSMFQEDMFGFLHNYTHPRPITAQEIDQVVFGCMTRLSTYCYWQLVNESNQFSYSAMHKGAFLKVHSCSTGLPGIILKNFNGSCCTGHPKDLVLYGGFVNSAVIGYQSSVSFHTEN